jgi:hypothetical protein
MRRRPLSSKLTSFKAQNAPELKTHRLQSAKCP